MAGSRQIGRCFKIIVTGGGQLHFALIRKAFQKQRIMEHPALNIFVLYAVNGDLSINTLVAGLILDIRNIKGYLDGKKIALVIRILVKNCLQLGIGAMLQIAVKELVTNPIEQQKAHKQQRGNRSQAIAI